MRPLGAAHGDADGDADDGGEREAREQPRQRFDDVARQDAFDGEAPERRGDLLQRREQPRREHAGMRGDLPHRAEHQERKRGARRHAQAALAARRRRGADVNGGNGVGHGGPSCASAIADAARVGGLGGSGKRAAVRHLRPPRGGILPGGRRTVRRRTSIDSSDRSATSAIFLAVLLVLQAFRRASFVARMKRSEIRGN